MEAGLQVCRRLEDARGHVAPHQWNVCRSHTMQEITRTWTNLQHEYLTAMVDAGRQPEAILQKLEVLSRKRDSRQKRHEYHLSRIQMAQEKRLLEEECRR